MKKEPIYLKLDVRNRISLTKLSKNLSLIYKARIHENKIILEPVQEIPEDEAWLFLPENNVIAPYHVVCAHSLFMLYCTSKYYA